MEQQTEYKNTISRRFALTTHGREEMYNKRDADRESEKCDRPRVLGDEKKIQVENKRTIKIMTRIM